MEYFDNWQRGISWEPYDEKARLCRMTLNSKLEKRSRWVCPQRCSRNVNQNDHYTTKKDQGP